MSSTSTRPAAGRAQKWATTEAWPAFGLVLLVAIAAVYSFSHRPLPPFPATQIHADRIMLNGLAAKGSRLVAVGEQGHILVADSPEGPWREAAVEKQRGSTLTQLAFAGGDVVLAVGHDSLILRSEDNGEIWKEVSFDPERSEPLLGIAGPYEGRLYAFGAFGQFLVSSDQGKTWTREQHEPLSDRHLNAMTRAADGSLLLVGERGLMARSADNGASWELLPEIYPGSFFGVLPLKDKGLVVFGMRGNVFRSNDGQNWQKSEVPEAVSLFGGTVTSDGSIVLVGAGDAVFVSQDGGAHFGRAENLSRLALADVLALQSGELLTAGEGGITRRSMNLVEETQPNGAQP